MKETPIERAGDPAPDLFTAEELALMNEADGTADELPLAHDAAELQRQYTALARMVAEGGERERQLRALVHDLTALAAPAEQSRAYHEQTQTLARLVMASSERELHLQQCLEAVRTVALCRARNMI